MDEITQSHLCLIDDFAHVSCSFDIQLTATRRNSRDGANKSVGINGPARIRPSAIYTNEVLPVAEQEFFDINVYSDIQNTDITF